MREIHFKIIRGLSLQESTARRWWTRHKTSGDLSRRVPPKQNRVLSAEQENSIIERITENPNLTATSLANEYGVSRSVILRLFRCHGILWRPDARETHLSEDDRIYRMAFCQMLLEEWMTINFIRSYSVTNTYLPLKFHRAPKCSVHTMYVTNRILCNQKRKVEKFPTHTGAPLDVKVCVENLSIY